MRNKEMALKIAVVGAGRMGMVVAKQLPAGAGKLIIDADEDKARACAKEVNGQWEVSLEAAKGADVVAVVVPAAAVSAIMMRLTEVLKDGAILINMATAAYLDASVKEKNDKIEIVDCRIVGHAVANAAYGAPCYIIAGTQKKDVFETISYVFAGYDKVIQGNADLVEELNGIGTKEALRCGMKIRKLLEPYKLEADLERVILYTVAGGTLQAFADGDFGHNAVRLMKELEAEEPKRGE